MTFFSRVGSILKQSVSKQIGSQIGSQISASNPTIYQSIRCMSSSKLFIGGLPYAVDDSSLRDTFSQYGEVLEARVIIDREQNRSRGFGFVTFASSEEASSAIQAMDGQDVQGRRVRVNYAADRAPRPFNGGYGGGGFGGGSGGYGGQSYGGGNSGGGYGGGQSYGGGNSGGGYGGGQSYGGGNSGGGYSGGQSYGGGNSGGGYGGGQNYGGGDSGGGFAGGATGGNVTADTGFASSGFEDSSTGTVGNDAGNFDPIGQPEGNFGDDEPDDFVKRA